MATRNFALTPLAPGFTLQYTISGLLNGDVSQPVRCAHFGQKTFTVTGTWGTGGNLVCEGSNDGTNWYTLSDVANVALGTITANSLKDLRSNPQLIRFRVSAGDGTTNLQVDMVCASQAGQIQ